MLSIAQGARSLAVLNEFYFKTTAIPYPEQKHAFLNVKVTKKKLNSIETRVEQKQIPLFRDCRRKVNQRTKTKRICQ